jgi:hypothetical protein
MKAFFNGFRVSTAMLLFLIVISTQTVNASDQEIETEECIEHVYDNGIITQEATCSENGTKEFTCTDCGMTKTEVIEKLGHNCKWRHDYLSDIEESIQFKIV